MADGNHSIKDLKILLCCIFLACSSYAIGNVGANTDQRARATIHGRDLRESTLRFLRNDDVIGRSTMRGEMRKLKKEDKWVAEENKKTETENPTAQPSRAPLESAQLVSASPTTSPTATMSSTPTRQPVAVELLPFSLLIHGSLTLEDETEVRQELEIYLLDAFREEKKNKLNVKSIGLEFIQMVESFLPFDDLNLNDKNDSNRMRRLLYGGTLEGYQWKRRLQKDWSVSTTSTLLKYQANAIIAFDQNGDGADTDGKGAQVALKDYQIATLENTNDLQAHFLRWFNTEQISDQNAPNDIPIVFMEVQVADRPTKQLNFIQTWQAIESIQPLDNGDRYGGNPFDDRKKEGERSFDDNGSSKSKVAVGIGCTVMILIGLGGLLFVWRKKRHQFSSKDMKSYSAKVDDHAIEVISDVDSDEHLDNIIYDKSVLRTDTTDSGFGGDQKIKNSKRSKTFFSSEILRAGKQQSQKSKPATKVTSPEAIAENESDENKNAQVRTSPSNPTESTSNNTSFESTNSGLNLDLASASLNAQNDIDSSCTGHDVVIDLTIPGTRNAKGFKAAGEEKPVTKSSLVVSAMSLFQNSAKKKAQEKQLDPINDDGDSVLKMNILNVTSTDDESMMGYSLASLNHDNESQKGHNDDNNTIEDIEENLSVASSQSGMRNPMFAGIQNILNLSINNGNNKLSANPTQNTVQIAPQIKNRWNAKQDYSQDLLGDIGDEEESSQSTSFEIECEQDINSWKEDGAMRDEDLSSIMSGFSSAGVVGDNSSHNINAMTTTTKKVASVGAAFIPDDVSDAPSDERNDDRLAVIPTEKPSSPSQSLGSIAHSGLLDNDPAVVQYLMKSDKSMEHKTQRRQKNHGEHPLTMEV